MLAAFLVQPEPPACALRPNILHLHSQRGRNAREGIGECGDQRPIAQIAHRAGWPARKPGVIMRVIGPESE